MNMPQTNKRITVVYLPKLEAPDLVLESDTNAGYAINSNEDGILGYRVWADKRTVLIPRDHVLRIDCNL
jgi:hypothetical protein